MVLIIIIPICVNASSNYKEKKEEFLDNIQEYFYRSTDRKQYKHVTTFKYEDNAYKLVNPISSHAIKNMLGYMNEKDQQAFKGFINSNWGKESEMERMAL